jgi:hypothetical protein
MSDCAGRDWKLPRSTNTYPNGCTSKLEAGSVHRDAEVMG